MRRTLLMITGAIIAIATLTSCQKEPKANFTASKTDVVTGEAITFTNKTVDGHSYEWNFDDGKIGTEENPTHSYEHAGIYNVELKAFSKNGKKSDKATSIITVTKTNGMQYDGNTYPLNKGHLMNLGIEVNNFYNLNVYLVSDDITITGIDMAGTGNVVFLNLWTNSPTELNPGTYLFSENISLQTFSKGLVALNFNVETELGEKYECTEGKVTISKNGTEYIFDVSLTLENGKTVNAYYKGAITYYNDDDED